MISIIPRNLHRLLVVEDEPSLRKLYTLTLQKAGYALDSVGSGEEAVKRIQAQHYDLVVLDLNMPGIDGLMVLEKLRACGIKTRVVIISAHLSDASLLRAVAGGVTDFVEKPTTPRALRRIIRSTFVRVPDDHFLGEALLAVRDLNWNQGLKIMEENRRRLTEQGVFWLKTLQDLRDMPAGGFAAERPRPFQLVS